VGVINKTAGCPAVLTFSSLPGTWSAPRSRPGSIVRDIERESRGGGGEDVYEVEPAQESGGDLQPLTPHQNRRLDPVERQMKRLSGDVAGVFETVGKPCAGIPADLGEDPPPPGSSPLTIILRGWSFPPGGEHLGKEAPLCLEVVLHRPMVVEVVLGEVGEDSQIECAIVNTA